MKKSFSDIDRQLFFNEHFIHAFYCNEAHVAYHNHRYFELVYVVSGTAIHKHDCDTRTISTGDFMFMDYSTYHEYSATSDDFAVINCLFLSKAIDKTMSNCHDFVELLKSYQFRLNRISMKDSPVNRFFHDSNGEIKELLIKMCDECGTEGIGHIDYMRCLLIQIIINTIRRISDKVETNYSPVVIKTIKFINENFGEKLHLADIAVKLYISLPYLSFKFKEETGMCFSQYLKKSRIERACMMLSTTNMKIHLIASTVGYSDYKRFGTVFREITGTSPGKFRASSRQ